VIACTFNELSPGEQAQRSHLFAAVQALLEMRSTLFLTDGFPGQLQMTDREIAEWAERLKQALDHAVFVYLSWVTDVLDSQASNASA
jgi:hypothetical protein